MAATRPLKALLRPNGAPRFQRRDLQGLRAVAVVLVVADHALGWPAGGFLGVDVFFVISGFLITGLLLREYRRSGHISFSGFYRRRAKRILPAATLVLAVTAVAAVFLLLRSRALSVLADTVWAFFFMANWHFASVGTDYFAQGAGTSPVQHFWSLSVEEQFYLGWPWLLLGLLHLRRRAGKAARAGRVAAAAIAVISLVSFLWGWLETTANPTVAYFSTFTRVWELGLGCLLAAVAGPLAALPTALRPWLSWGGLAVIAGAALHPMGAMPVPGATLAVAGSAAVIVAGIGEEPRGAVLLTNPVSVYLGDISYSWYLWHFPILVLGGTLLPGHRVVHVALALFSLVIAMVAYHTVENPLHHSPWLTPGRGPAAWSMWRQTYAASARAFALVGVLAWAGFGAGLVAVDRYQADKTTSGTAVALPAASTGGAATAAMAAAVRSAVTATAWPTLRPSLDDAAADRGAAFAGQCLEPATADPSRCVFGTGTRRALVVGDSYAVAMAPAFEEALRPRGLSVQVFGYYSCAVADAPMSWPSQPDFEAACARAKAAWPALVRQTRPAVVYVVDSEVGYDAVVARAGAAAWPAARQRALAALQATGVPVVLVEANPQGKDVNTCATLLAGPADCAAPVSASFADKWLSDKAVAVEVGIPFVDTRALFEAESTVPAFADGIPQRSDAGHLTDTYARHIGPGLAELLPARM